MNRLTLNGEARRAARLKATTKKARLIAPLLGGTILGTALWPQDVYACVNDPDEIKELSVPVSRDKISVSGRLPTVYVVSSNELMFADQHNAEVVLKDLPQLIPAYGASSNSPGDGTATLDLRGLGVNRTLVLVNGKRLGGAGVTGITDINNIPPALIDRVELVTGGLSAQHGSGAMAGIVNFVLRDSFKGLEVSGVYELSNKGDADKYSMNALWGDIFDGKRGHTSLFFGYTKRQSVSANARDFSTFDLSDGIPTGQAPNEFGLGGGLVAGSSNGTPDGHIFNLPVGFTNPCGDESVSFTRDAIFSSSGEFRPWCDAGPNSSRYNYIADNYLQVPQERWSVRGTADYNFGSSAQGYIDAMWVSNLVPQRIAPAVVFQTLEINPDSPFFGPNEQSLFNFFRLDTNGNGSIDDNDNALFFVGRRMSEVGPRRWLDKRNMVRILTGLQGAIGDGWRYDVSYRFARTENDAAITNGISLSRYLQATAVADDGTTCQDETGDCIPANIYGANNLSTAAADFIRANVFNKTSITNQEFSAWIQGPLGGIGFEQAADLLLGVEYRADSYDFTPDTTLTTGDVVGLGSLTPVAGTIDSYDAFSELHVPIFNDQEKPFIYALDLTLAARFSAQSPGSSDWSYNGRLNWTIKQGLTLFGSYDRAIRQPNGFELFEANNLANRFELDPCSVDLFSGDGPDPSLQRICVATGVPADLFGIFTASDLQSLGVYGGNQSLNAETSETFNVGLSVASAETSGFSFTINYYDVRIKNVIAPLGTNVNQTLNNCYRVTQDPTSPYCQAITRHANGEIATIDVGDANIGHIETKGVDVAWSYKTTLDIGLLAGRSDLEIAFIGTHVMTRDITRDIALGKTYHCADAFGIQCGAPDPSYRFNLRTTLNDGPLSLSINWRWMSNVTDDRLMNTDEDALILRTELPVPLVGSESYFDVAFGYAVTKKIEIHGGVRNLFGNKPTHIGDAQDQANTYPETYDVIGTRFWLGARLSF